ncbi:phosphoprotein [Bangoran virus]|uniref:phosphoprotein n=1 Tax=Bangoran virus TaxID=864693 RepID=UPI002481A99D|nr:phosphoprotein [Bangoran virus]UAX43318.1 phosphoprotein [Bangoran virus]
MSTYQEPKRFETGLKWEQLSQSMANIDTGNEDLEEQVKQATIPIQNNKLDDFSVDLKDWVSNLDQLMCPVSSIVSEDQASFSQQNNSKSSRHEKQSDSDEERQCKTSETNLSKITKLLEDGFEEFYVGKTDCSGDDIASLIKMLVNASASGKKVDIDSAPLEGRTILYWRVENSNQIKVCEPSVSHDSKSNQGNNHSLLTDVLSDLSVGIPITDRFEDTKSKLIIKTHQIPDKVLIQLSHESFGTKRECLDKLLVLTGKYTRVYREYHVDY